MKAKQAKDRDALPNASEKVDAYTAKLKHPLAWRPCGKSFSALTARLGEEIKWNAPAFFYSGELKPAPHKNYTPSFFTSSL